MIDEKLLTRVKNNSFTLKHISKTELEKISNINFVLFVFWLNKDNIIIKDNFYRYSKDITLTIYQDMAYNHYLGISYKPLLFLQAFENYSYRQSLYLLNYYFYKISKADVSKEFKAYFGVEKTTTDDENIKADLQYILNENLLNSSDADVKASALRRTYAYLTNRGFERFTIQNMISQNWLMVDKLYNLCFITYEDENKDKVKAITKKGTSYKEFKCNYNNERHTGFYYAPKGTEQPIMLFVFESVLDLFSFVQLHWLKRIQIDEPFACISLNGAYNLKYIYKVLNQNISINKVVLCLDNDYAGCQATQKLKRQLVVKSYDLRPVLKTLPTYVKDWNEALKYTQEINIDISEITA